MLRQTNRLSSLSILLATLFFTCACTIKTPSTYKEVSETAVIYPDFVGVTMPRNMAAPRFHIDNEGDDFITEMASGGVSYTYQGCDVSPELSEWDCLKEASEDVVCTVYAKRQNAWQRMPSFHIYVSPDSIDPYISYRLIAPSYVAYEDLTIKQRCLENYDESTIYGNMINSDENDGQCINCHAYQGGNPERMQFHCRQAMGGTVISYDGKTQKVDLKIDGIISAGVYPAWHPTEALIAYSVNKTGQTFHTIHRDKIEVQDQYGDLILYDIEANRVYPLPSDSMRLDCFPTWTPDGKYLYYCSALYTPHDSTLNREMDIIQNYRDIHYQLYRREFNLAERSFGAEETVYDTGDTLSATLPRISPDGRYLMFTLAHYGVFHIWHSDAELMLMDLTTGQVRNIREINSDNVESFHNFSSNGRWVVFSTRREDGNFTRLYFAHMNADGTFSKPTPMPSEYPEYYRDLLRSYNVPELMKGKVTVSAHNLADVIKKEAKKANK